VVRAYRLYLAGSAMSFERGWLSLHQMLAARPSGQLSEGRHARRTIGVSFQPRIHLPMIYKFRSKSTGDVIMMGPHADQMLHVLGREPAAQGIIDVDQLAAAIAALRAAVRDAEAMAEESQDEEAPGRNAVSLRQRLWPVIEMFERALAAKEPVVWGV
jgi:cyclopropane-fatty-acyl-phospholipid synthase